MAHHERTYEILFKQVWRQIIPWISKPHDRTNDKEAYHLLFLNGNQSKPLVPSRREWCHYLRLEAEGMDEPLNLTPIRGWDQWDLNPQPVGWADFRASANH
jgi:hypothetical protein